MYWLIIARMMMGRMVIARMMAAARRLYFPQSASRLAVVSATSPHPAHFGPVVVQHQPQFALQNHGNAQVTEESVCQFSLVAHGTSHYAGAYGEWQFWV